MTDRELRSRVEDLLSVSRTAERREPASPETVALSALLVGQVVDRTVRCKVAGAVSVEDLLTWLAVDRLLRLLPAGAPVPALGNRQPAQALGVVAGLVAEVSGRDTGGSGRRGAVDSRRTES